MAALFPGFSAGTIRQVSMSIGTVGREERSSLDPQMMLKKGDFLVILDEGSCADDVAQYRRVRILCKFGVAWTKRVNVRYRTETCLDF